MRVQNQLKVGMITVAGVLALSSVALACTVSHQGRVWFCPTANCDALADASWGPYDDDDVTFFSGADGLLANTNYRVRYIAIDSMGLAGGQACNASADSVGDHTTDNTGDWDNVSMPIPEAPLPDNRNNTLRTSGAGGVWYEICAMPFSATNPVANATAYAGAGAIHTSIFVF